MPRKCSTKSAKADTLDKNTTKPRGKKAAKAEPVDSQPEPETTLNSSQSKSESQTKRGKKRTQQEADASVSEGCMQEAEAPPKAKRRGCCGGGARSKKATLEVESEEAVKKSQEKSTPKESQEKKSQSKSQEKKTTSKSQEEKKSPAKKIQKKSALKEEEEKEKEEKEEEEKPEEANEETSVKKTKGKPSSGKKSKAKKAEEDTEEDEGEEESASSVVPVANMQVFNRPAAKFTYKFVSWNVNGIKAFVNKPEGIKYLKECNADIIALQEVKCDQTNIPKEAQLAGYKPFFSSGSVKSGGYAGTALLCRKEPLNVKFGIGIPKHDNEGRVVTAEYDKFYFVCAYVPNSGQGLPRLNYRIDEWDKDFFEYLRSLDKKKPVIYCGDLNVAHTEIDLARPKGNQRTAGFTPQERASFDAFLKGSGEQSFVDSFRRLYPKATGVYSFWSARRNSRASNIGWRLDYFIISKRIEFALHESSISTTVKGSDHCPIELLLDTF